MLWSLSYLSINFEEIRALEGLESEILVMEVTVIDDRGVEGGSILHNDLVGLFRDHTGRLVVLRVYYTNIGSCTFTSWTARYVP